MFKKLLELDNELFELIHIGLQHQLLDVCMVFIRSPYIWYPLYFFVLTFLLINYGKKAILPIVFISCGIGSADAISSHLIKKNVKRLRPCNQPELNEKIRPILGCGRAYSFTSSHAANHFCMATVFGLFLPLGRRWKVGLLIWASSICFAQVYVAAHFPSDVLVGGLLGIIIGLSFFAMYKRLCVYLTIPQNI